MTARRGLFLCTLMAALTSFGATCQDPSLTISPIDVENGVVGEIYSESFNAGGSTDGSWSVSEGQLPAGLSLNSNNGNLSGTPTAAGDFAFKIALNRFPFGGTAERSYQMTVQPKLEVDFSPEVARQNAAYAYTVGVTGGVPPYAFEIIGLPAGLSLDEESGEISGTPVEIDEGRNLLITVTDSGDPQQIVDQSATFRIRPPAVEITTLTLDPGRVTVNYQNDVEIINGQSPFTFSVTDGALPPGLMLPDSQSTGRISGVPTEAGTFTFTITVTDSDDPESSDSMEYTIMIVPE